MIEKYFAEFSQIYCRLMRLEISIKQRIIISLLGYYKEDILNVFEKFFFNKERLCRYKTKNGNSFLAILRNPQIQKDSIKFIKLVNVMFLSDVLFIILCCEQFRKKEIIENFYSVIPEKFGKLTKSRQQLLDLRNTIAHYNFKNYEQNKQTYLEVLKSFEIYLGLSENLCKNVN